MTPRLGILPERLASPTAAFRAAGIGALALSLEWARVLAARQPELSLASLVAGGVALSALGLGFGARDLGLSRSRLGLKLVGGVVVGFVLLLPALARQQPGPPLPAPYAV